MYKPVLLRLLVPKAHTAARKSETDAFSIAEPTFSTAAIISATAAAENVVENVVSAAAAPELTTANAAEPSSAEPVVASGPFGLAAADPMNGAALLRCRLRHLLAEAGASITVPLPRRERLALLGALFFALPAATLFFLASRRYRQDVADAEARLRASGGN